MEETKLWGIEVFIYFATDANYYTHIVLLDLKISKVNSVKCPTCARVVTHTWNPLRSKHGSAVVQWNESRHWLLKSWEAESNPQRLQKSGLELSPTAVFFSSHPSQAQRKLQTAPMCRPRAAPPAFVASAFVSKWKKTVGETVGKTLSSAASKVIGFLSAEPNWKKKAQFQLTRHKWKKGKNSRWKVAAIGSNWETKRRPLIWLGNER